MRKLTMGTVLDMLIDKYTYALKHDLIHKPMAWALYETWKYVDEKEKWRDGSSMGS